MKMLSCSFRVLSWRLLGSPEGTPICGREQHPPLVHLSYTLPTPKASLNMQSLSKNKAIQLRRSFSSVEGFKAAKEISAWDRRSDLQPVTRTHSEPPEYLPVLSLVRNRKVIT